MSNMWTRVRANPKFDDLVNRRRRFAWLLTGLVLGIFFAYLMIGILQPAWLMVPLFEGSTTTIGYPLSAALVVLAWVSTGIYVRRANNEFDPKAEEILREAKEK
uniref:DUF485 domain-containing protein n=1 Tax=Castellaniella defragrans TaxID=75697 RepID=UPI00333F84E8